MKTNVTFILGFLIALLLILFSSHSRTNEIDITQQKTELARLSKNIRVINFVSSNDLAESLTDDEEDIIYPNEFTGKKDKHYFVVEDFIKYDKNADDSTIYKIKTLHIPQLERVRDVTGLPIIIKSGARSYEHEIARGRSGKSQHVFKSGKGAVDVSLTNHSAEELNKLEEAVFKNTEYTRVARYPSFLHLDYYPNRYGNRGYYRNTKEGWIYIGEILDEQQEPL